MEETLETQLSENEMVQDFIEKFYETFSYYPTVIIKSKKKNLTFSVISLNDLEKCFTTFLPKKYNKTYLLGSKIRIRELVELRFIFCHIARKMAYGLKDIGLYLNRDHTTVLHGLRTFRNLYQTDEYFREKYHKIINIIKTNYESSAMDDNYTMETESESDILT